MLIISKYLIFRYYMNNSILNNENHIKKIEESHKKICDDLLSNNQHATYNSSNVSIIKIGKDKFISVVNKKIKPVINIESNVKLNKNVSRCYDLNDFDYDDDF